MAHAADTHLGKKFVGLGREDRDRDVEEAFSQMMELILLEHVKLLVIAGDLFDKPRPSNSTLIFFRESVREFLERGGKIVLVNGEHDTSTASEHPATYLVSKYLSNVYHLKHFFGSEDALCLEDGGDKTCFYGLGAIRGPKALVHGRNIMGKIESVAKSSPGKKVMVSHISIKDYFPFAEGYELSSLPSGISYYALGHLHFRAVERVKDGVLAYPGSLEILSLSEVPEWKKKGKGFYIVDLSPEEPVVHQVDLDVRPQEVFEISSEEDIPSFASSVEKLLAQLSGGRPPIINVVVRGGEGLRKVLQSRLEKLQKSNAIFSVTSKPAEDSSLDSDFAADGEWEELKIVKKIVGDEAVAKLIIDLKNCLSSSEESKCDDIAGEILERRDYWEKALKQWPLIGKAQGERKEGLKKFMS